MIQTGKRKNNKTNNGPFAKLDHEIAQSKSFQELTVHAKWLYVEFLLRYNGKNKYNISFTQKEAEKIMSTKAFKKARNQLIERGFIDLIRRGGLWKQCSIFALSDRWRKYGTPEFEKVNIKDILPPIYKHKFSNGHEFLGNQYKQK
jgi:hypothetical protein